MKQITTALFLFFSVLGLTQEMLTPEQMLEDLNEIIYTLDAHPQPYRNITEQEYQKQIDNARLFISEPLTSLDFYKVCAPIIHYLRDGHSAILFSIEEYEKLLKRNGVFPYRVHLTDDLKMYITKDYGKLSPLPIGAEIKTINGITISQFIEKIDKYTFYEREQFRNSRIENDINLYLMLCFGAFDKIDIECFTHKTISSTVNNISYKRFAKKEKKKKKSAANRYKKSMPFEYENLKSGIGHLKIHSFSISNYKAYSKLLSSVFKKIQKDNVTSLILDVRGNLGGSSYATVKLFHYLTNTPFAYLNRSEMKISIPYRKYCKQTFPFLDYDLDIREKHLVDYYSLFHDSLGSLKIEVDNYKEKAIFYENEYQGDLYLLIDRSSFSASTILASLFKELKVGVIIGEATGGTTTFFNGAIRKELKNSKLKIYITTKKNYSINHTQEENEPVYPNIVTSPTIMELLNESDQMLYYTIRLIKKLGKI